MYKLYRAGKDFIITYPAHLVRLGLRPETLTLSKNERVKMDESEARDLNKQLGRGTLVRIK